MMCHALRASHLLASKKPIGLLLVPSVGIEPTLQAPQACVLSIERQGHDVVVLKMIDDIVAVSFVARPATH